MLKLRWKCLISHGIVFLVSFSYLAYMWDIPSNKIQIWMIPLSFIAFIAAIITGGLSIAYIVDPVWNLDIDFCEELSRRFTKQSEPNNLENFLFIKTNIDDMAKSVKIKPLRNVLELYKQILEQSEWKAVLYFEDLIECFRACHVRKCLTKNHNLKHDQEKFLYEREKKFKKVLQEEV